MRYETLGSGRPVVLIHGWCGHRGQWGAAIPGLAEGHRVLAVDLVGHGESAGQARTAWTIAAFGDDVARLLEAEDLTDAILVGHSMGGPVALEAAARAPERVSAVVGVESLHRLGAAPDPEQRAPYIARFREDFGGAMGESVAALVHPDTPATVRELIAREAAACDAAMGVALMEHFGTYDPGPATRVLDCPVRCINSEATPTDVAGNRALLTSFDARLLAGTGHWPQLESPGPFSAALLEVLTELAPAEEVGLDPRVVALAPIVRCEDLVATRDFYVGHLRFEVADLAPEEEAEDLDGQRSVTLVRDAAVVVLQTLDGLREDLPEITLPPGATLLRLEVTNLGAELEGLGPALRVVVPERRLADGTRQVVIEDPAGSLVVLRQPVERP